MSTEVQEQQAQYDAQKAVRVQTRNAELLAKDFSTVSSLDSLYDGLSVAEIKMLDAQNASFKAKLNDFNRPWADSTGNLLIDSNGNPRVDRFRLLTKEAQELFLASLTPEQRSVIDADYDARTAAEAANQPPAPAAPIVAQEESEKEKQAALQAEADRIAAEAAAAGTTVTVPKGVVEELYDGVEKLGDKSYKLTVDPGDGTPAEIFYGESQKDCFKKLRKSKANATKELRRRRNTLKITDELKSLQVEKINYPPLITPIPLTPDEIFKLTERRKELEEELDDPTKVIKATKELREIGKKLELASLTFEECEKLNKPELDRRYAEGHNIGAAWIKTHPDFYFCDENINALAQLMAPTEMGGLNWAMTVNNLDRAFQILKDQGVLLDRPESEDSKEDVQPASVVPVTPSPAPQAPPVATPPAAPTGVLPEPVKVLRPGSSSTGMTPTRRVDSVSTETPKVVLTVEMYNQMPAAEVKLKYQRDSEFRKALDKLVAEGKI